MSSIDTDVYYTYRAVLFIFLTNHIYNGGHVRSWGHVQASDITRVLLPPLTFAVVLSSHHVFALVACVHRCTFGGICIHLRMCALSQRAPQSR